MLLLLQVEDALLPSWLDRRTRVVRSGSPPTPPLGMADMPVMRWCSWYILLLVLSTVLWHYRMERVRFKYVA